MSNKQAAEAAFSAVEKDLQATSKWMYDNPELGFEEFETSRKLSEFLAAHGFGVDYPTHGVETAFAATVGTTGPRVVICCEYDALPVV